MSPTTNPPGLRSEAEIQERLRLLLTQLPQRTDDEKDRECAYLAALLFALGADWTDARLKALSLWNERSPVQAEQKCGRCLGCGQIANDEDGTPWIYWMALPVQSAAAVVFGIVRPLPCPACQGMGMLPATEEANLFGRDLWPDHAPADVPVG